MYAEIIKTVEESRVKRNHIFLDKCAAGTEAAIRELDVLKATIFVKNLFDLPLVFSKNIVDNVKKGVNIYDAYNQAQPF